MLSLLGEAGKEPAAAAADAHSSSAAAGGATAGDARQLDYFPVQVDKKVAKTASQTLAIVTSFFRQAGEELLGILPRKQRQFRSRVPADTILDWPPVLPFVNASMRNAVRRALDRYFDAISQYQVRQHGLCLL